MSTVATTKLTTSPGCLGLSLRSPGPWWPRVLGLRGSPGVSPSQPAARAFVAVLVGLLTACAATPAEPGSPPPERFSLKLQKATTDSRYTYFVLASNGELSFGGGQDAAVFVARPVTTLTPQQRQQIWDIITRHKLLQAPGNPFGKPFRVAYEVTIETGRMSGRSFRCLDDQVAGVAELHDLLFKVQADVRYGLPGLQ